VSEFTRGFRDAGRGLAFLNAHPRLWRWVIAPAAVTSLLLLGLVIAVSRLTARWVAALTGYMPTWLEGVAGWVLTILVLLALVAGAWILLATIAGVIAGPFCEMLSEAVEEQLTGRKAAATSLGAILREATVGLGHTVRRLLAAVLGAGLLIAISLLPIAGAIAAVAMGAWFAARAAAYDSYDAVLARRGLAYRDKLAFLQKHRSRAVGLGAAVAVMLLIPGVNLIALGLGAVGATLAVHELDGRDLH
jgi:CysZ protein